MRPNTKSTGADLERQAWVAKVRRLVKKYNAAMQTNPVMKHALLPLMELTAFGQERTDRVNTKSGGLGKR